MIKRTILLVAIAVALAFLLWVSQRRQPRISVSGFIEADEIRVGSRVGGRVKAVHVFEGQTVSKGDLLVELEPFDLSERLAEARAQRARAQSNLDLFMAGFRPEEIAQARARTRQLEANLKKLEEGPRQQEIDAAAAELELAQSELDLALKQYERAESLIGQKAISREAFDMASTEARVARSRVQVKRRTLDLLREGTRQEDVEQARAQLEESRQALELKERGYRSEEIEEAQATLRAAEAGEQAIERQIDELRIEAPVNGTIEALELQPGDLVGTNAPVISILDNSNLWVRTYVPENRLNLRIGQELPITVDSYPGQQFSGRVTYIARDAEFTPRNVQTPEERSKQVFRVKVTLTTGLDRLRPGMSADVWLDDASADEASSPPPEAEARTEQAHWAGPIVEHLYGPIPAAAANYSSFFR
jgi:multidrug resistance efflux pump